MNDVSERMSQFGGALIPAGLAPIDFRAALNDDQYAAVTAPPGPALVLAGAGSGKTRTLTYRVAWLMHQGVDPEQILLLTFTNKAAREMVGRVEALTGESRWQRLLGGTFHSVGHRFLRRHGESAGLQRNFTILDEGDAEALLNDVVRARDPAFTKHKEHPKPSIIHGIVSYARNTRQTLETVIVEKYPWLEELSGQLRGFCDAYQQAKREKQVADYDDLLEYWLLALQKDEIVRTHYQRLFKHILVDEYQDTNKLQSDIVDLLASEHQVMAVGDDAQCIYTWRGANFANIGHFSDRHPGARIYKIEINYRSTPEILRFANGILRNQPATEGYRKELRAVRKMGRKPAVVAALDTRQQAQLVIARIRELHNNESVALSDIAVLYRAHYQAMDLQLELSRSAVPFTITSGVRFFEQAHVRDLVSHLRFAHNPRDTVAFTRLAALLPKVGPRTADKILAAAESTRGQRTLIQMLTSDNVLAKVPEGARGDFKDMALTLQNLEEALAQAGAALMPQRDIPGSGPGENAAPPKSLEQSALFEEEAKPAEIAEAAPPDRANSSQAPKRGRNDPVVKPQEVVRIAIEGWYGDYMRNIFDNWESRREDLDGIIGFASRFGDMNELLAQLVLLNSETSDRAVNSDAESIRLTTIHQAKGLEFPVVFIIGAADGMLPLKRAIEEGDVEEERRLFYVASTRAMDELYVVYPRVVMQNGPPSVVPASRFIDELNPEDYDQFRAGG